MGTLNKDKAAVPRCDGVPPRMRKLWQKALEADGVNMICRPTRVKDCLAGFRFLKNGHARLFSAKDDVVVIRGYPAGVPTGHIAFHTGT